MVNIETLNTRNCTAIIIFKIIVNRAFVMNINLCFNQNGPYILVNLDVSLSPFLKTCFNYAIFLPTILP